MGEGWSLTELVEAASRRDPDAWRALVDRFQRLVWSVARGFGLSDHDAHDAVQVVWLQLARRIGQISDPERLGLWLATTTRRECIRLLAANRPERNADLGDYFVDEPATTVGVEETVLEKERREALWRAVAELPGNCQALVRIFLAEPPPTYAEVAAALGMPVNSVGPRRQRCLALLRAAVIAR